MKYDPEYQIANNALGSALYIDGLLRNEIINNEKKYVESLSKTFNKLSEENMYTMPFIGSLAEFYFQEDFQGKTIDDLIVQSTLFAKELSGIGNSSKERQKEIMDECIRLHWIMLRYSDDEIYRLVA